MSASWVECQCAVCMAVEWVILNVANDDSSTGWVACTNSTCMQWFHIACVTIGDLCYSGNGWLCMMCLEEQKLMIVMPTFPTIRLPHDSSLHLHH